MVRPIEKRTLKSFFWLTLAGAFGGFMIAIPGILIGSRVLADNSLGGFEDLVGALMGMVIGYPIGVVLGILVFSKVYKYRGTIWLAVLGAIIGPLIILGLAEPLNLNVNPDVLLGSYFLVTALLSSAGFHLRKA